jgi:hypothetical protein
VLLSFAVLSCGLLLLEYVKGWVGGVVVEEGCERGASFVVRAQPNLDLSGFYYYFLGPAHIWDICDSVSAYFGNLRSG